MTEYSQKNELFTLVDNPANRYTFYPIDNRKYYDHYKGQLAVFWTAEEVDLSKDREHYEALNENEKTFIKNILAFFAASDGIVAENLSFNFIEEVNFKDVSTLLRFQAMMEDIHGEMYSLMIDNLITDNDERAKCLNAINDMPAIKLKGDWALKWANQDSSLPRRLIAWACVEGIQFSGAFSAICYMGQRNIMPGLLNANEFIRRDENSHVKTSIMLYNDLKEEHRLSQEEVESIVREAVEVEKVFMTESIPCSMLGMNVELMKQYIEYVADQLLVQIGYNKIWKTANPFEFMVNMSLENKTNFFEHRVSEYNKSGVGTSEEDRELTFDDDVEF
jgi:ribonucleotide reductase beta subunit family protein with ferritin-like domain